MLRLPLPLPMPMIYPSFDRQETEARFMVSLLVRGEARTRTQQTQARSSGLSPDTLDPLSQLVSIFELAGKLARMGHP